MTKHMEKQHKLTIGIPTYNDGEYIREALDSLLSQTFKDFKIIISDNASADTTGVICKEYAQKYQYIEYICHETNKGAAFNWNYVLEKADTPYFMWAEGHDLWSQYYVEKLLNLLISSSAVNAHAYMRDVFPDGSLAKKIRRNDPHFIQSPDPYERCQYAILRLAKTTPLHGIWETSVLKRISPYKRILSPDSLLLMHASLEGSFVQTEEILGYFRNFHFKRGGGSRETEKKKYLRQLQANAKKKPTDLNLIFLGMWTIGEHLYVLCQPKYIKQVGVLKTFYLSVAILHKLSKKYFTSYRFLAGMIGK